VDLADPRDFADAQNHIGRFVADGHNTPRRIRSPLGNLILAEFKADDLIQQGVTSP